MTQHETRLGRIGLGEELHRSERIEQKMRLDLRLHQLQFGFDGLLGEQVAVGFRTKQLRAAARLAELDEEEQADEQSVAEAAQERPCLVSVGKHVDEPVTRLADDRSFHQKCLK